MYNNKKEQTKKTESKKKQQIKYCDCCGNAMTASQYEKQQGLCFICIDAMN